MKSSFTIIFTIFIASFMVAQTGSFSMADLDYGLTTQSVIIKDDIKIAYSDQGKGSETILFIHGLASYIPAWKNNVSALQTDYRCIAIDLPGYGKSSKGNYKVSMDFFAEVIHDFCVKLNIKNVVLAGHSMGGQISISTALKYPDLVSKLILVAPAGFETFHKGQRQWFRDVMTVDGVKLTTVEQIRVNYAYNFYDMPKEAQFMIDDRIKIRTASDFTDYCYHITQGVNAMVDSPVFDFLSLIKQPTLCIFGSNDNLIPNRFLNGGPTEKFAKAGAEKIPNCTLNLVEKGGHFIMFEKATEVNGLIKEFLK
ncbi:MAG TPA: alpha/beta hydrolase [Saprospiraceae bacterium]|nr:alpha/beta hydrolase [Saprospiraceae bacterium]